MPPPLAFAAMCRRTADWCRTASARRPPDARGRGIAPREPAQDGAADAVRREVALLAHVNAYVNHHVAQRSDQDTTGQSELWRRSGVGRGAAGDCEDIAIEKRYELVARGFAPERLAFAIAYSHVAGLHAVLVARTDQGDVVLDSRTSRIVRWIDAPYQWIGIQSMRDPGRWFRLG